MMSNEFEKALDAFLEGADADEAHQALYDIIRAAFLAGWRSAGGDPPQEQKLFELIPGGKPLEPTQMNNEIAEGSVFPVRKATLLFFAPFSGESARKG
ncbi:hypothetical protein LEA_06139, partial [human gut metagenome]